jgi:hypothetical protein
MLDTPRSIHHPRWRTVLLSALLVCGLGVVVSPQVQLDVCGCRNSPGTLGSLEATDPSTYPPGTTSLQINTMEIPLPPDGVLVFNGINLVERPPYIGYGLTVRFIRNAANTPVTILVNGNVNIGTRVTLQVSGDPGVNANTNDLGKGGLGGPGGFRGGDGGYQLVNFGLIGGAGLGPGGGLGGRDTYFANGHGGGGTFLGAPDLLPLIGGSGGGGGASTDPSAGCAGGGGGGGGGAILMAVNGTLSIDGSIVADGGTGGSYGNPSCASLGGGGSGGAVRLLATTINGSGQVYARPGGNGVPASQPGSIRLEALNNTLSVGNTTPLAARAAGPGPIVNPVTPTVAITSVGGQPIPQPPQGGLGNVDLVLPAPGQTDVGFATTGVPTGTTVNVTVKPRVGGAPIVTPVTLTTCDTNGSCLGNVSFNLAAGAYFVEARATFSTP